jgi:hypothetical protein
MIGLVGVDEAGRLLAVHAFLELAVQERVLDFQLVDRTLTGCGDGEHSADRCGFHHRREGLIKINPRSLIEPANDPASFSPFQCAIRMEFVAVDPFSADDVRSRRSWYQCPRAIPLEGVKFILHGGMPIWITERGRTLLGTSWSLGTIAT